MTETNLNIPELTVTQAVNQLAALYTSAISRGSRLRSLPTPFFWGAAGVGKSDGVRQLASMLEASTSKRCVVTDVRLLLFNPIDLRGIPFADEKHEFAHWLRPKIFNMDPSDGIINLLFLDELTAAPQSLQASAYQLCLDRCVGEHALPDNCIVIAAGNRTTDRSVSFTMPKALCNRLMHFTIRTDFSAWREWAMKNHIDPRVIGFLSFDNSRLCAEPSADDMAYPTPRSWAFVSELLRTTGTPPEAIHHMIAACVGTDTAVEFEEWCKSCDDLPPIELILSGTCREYPKTHDRLYALMESLTEAVRTDADSISVERLEHVCAYAKRFPADFALAFFTDLNANEKISAKLVRCRSMQDWLIKNKQYI